MADKKKTEKKIQYQPLYQKIVFKFCGIPVWSVTREIDSRQIYDEISQKLLATVEAELMNMIKGAKK